MNDSILFYSLKCPYSVQCLELLQPYSDKINFIGYVNIHDSKGNLPLVVRRVPTLIINGGETIHEGRDVYLWIYGLVNMIQSQQNLKEQKKETLAIEELETTDSNGKDPLETVWSSSTLIGNNTQNNVFASINNNKTITETINYSKIKSIKQDQEKVTLSPDSIQDIRNNELENIIPKQIKRF